MKHTPVVKNRERGIAVIFTALSLLSIIPLVGLAVDAGILFTVKGKLQMAVDAAALAGARALSRGSDDTAQQNNAKNVAQEYALLNFPSGYFNITQPAFNSGDITVDETVANQRSVTVNTSVSAPLYFLRWLGNTATTVAATATAVRRDVNVIIVLDRSGSLANTSSCAGLQAAAVSFVNNAFASGRDQVGLVTYATSSRNDFTAGTNFATASPSVATIINNITCTGGTNTAEGLYLAYQQLVTINQPAALNVVLLFTDGYPNTFTASFPILSSSSCSTKTNKVGVMAAGYSDPINNPTSPSAVWGLMDDNAPAQPIASDLTLTNNSSTTNCTFASSWSNNATKVAQDVASIPNTDYYGSTINSGYQSLSTSSGAISVTPTNVQNAGWNAADSMGLRIRNSTTIPNIHSYSIGLGNSGGVPADFLERVANDAQASNYDNTKAVGLYVYAPTTADLSDAFAQVASQILHLAK